MALGISGRFNKDHNEFDNWPLEKMHTKRIKRNFAKLVKEIDNKYATLIDALLTCDCINHEQSQIIRAAQSVEDMNRKLLAMLFRRSIKDYNEFVKCLEKSGMQHVVQEFHLDIGDVDPISSSEPSGPGGNVTSSDVTDAQDHVPLLSSLDVSSSSASEAPLKSFQLSVPFKKLPETVASQTSSQQADVTESKTTKRKLHVSIMNAPQPSSQTDVITPTSATRQLDGNFLFSLTPTRIDSYDSPARLNLAFAWNGHNVGSAKTTCFPRAVTSPPINPSGRGFGDACAVTGVAIIGKNFYIVYKRCDNIVKYNEDDVTFTGVIKVKDIRSPRDVVGNSNEGMLFVCDKSQNVIWLVSPDKEVIKKFAEIKKPLSLSLVGTRLLVTSPDSVVLLNSQSGDVISKTPLPKDTKKGSARHSIESGRETLFVSFFETVVEMNFNGDEVRRFNNEQQITCYYLALVGHRLFVADYYNERICVLDEELKFQGFHFDNDQLDNERPRRLNYDKENNRLAVGLYNGHVKIFKI